MGIRVHKMLGYGLTDLQVGGGRIMDARINTSSPWATFDNMPVSLWEFTNRRRSDLQLAKDDPRRYIVHDTEYGLSNVVCIRPGWIDDWYRYDNSIDWVEETYLRGEDEAQRNWVRVLPHGLHPWNGSYMDDRTGEKVPTDIMTWVRVRGMKVTPDDAMAGFADHEDAAAHCVPFVPTDVREVAEWADLFTNPDVWRQLRPMVYCWWA